MALTETRLDKILGVGSGTGSRPAAGQTGARWVDTSTTPATETVDNGSSYVALGGGGSGASWAWVTKSANYTILAADTNILVDASGAARTMTLPTAVSSTQRVTIKKKDSSTNTVTVATTSAQTIDGSSNYIATLQNESVTVVSDGSNWYIE
jgi:hypothetical protein